MINEKQRGQFVKLGWASALAGSLYLTASLVQINPGLLDPRQTVGWSQPLVVPQPVVLLEKTDPKSLATFTYRENPTRTGVYEKGELPFRLKEKWRTQALNLGIHGASKSSPAVDDTGVYVGADTGWFYAFNHNGSLKWKFFTFDPTLGVHGTALLDEENVYFGSYNGRFYSLRKADGRLAWVTLLADAIGSSPVSEGDFLYVSAETGSSRLGVLYKLRKSTGETVWYSHWLPDQIHSSPTLDFKHRQVFVGCNDGNYYVFNMDSGKMIRKIYLGGEIKGTGLLLEDTIYVSSWAQKLFAIDTASGQILWAAPLSGRSQSSPTYVKGKDLLVIAASGRSHLHGIERATGKLRWTKPIKSFGMFSPITATAAKNQYVWSLCDKNVLCSLKADTGEVLSEVAISNPFTGVPTPYKNFLYISVNEGPLVKFGP